MLSGFGGHIAGLDALNLIPWTESIFDGFEERYGYRVDDHLPELFLRKDGQEVSAIKHQYNELLLDLFLENYAKPYYDWCQANGLMATGHVLHENSLACQVSNIGSVQAYYPYMHIPGIDYLGEHGRHYWVAKQIDSVARQYERPWVLSELYGLSGWQINFESIKAVGAWQALFGVNVRCHHLSWYNMAGASKRDYPTSFLHQSPWYVQYHFVETWFSRLGYFRSLGKPCCDLLVLNPVESLWGRVYPGAIQGMCSKDVKMAQIDEDYVALFHMLAGNQIDFDYGDEGLLKDKGAVETTDGSAVLRLGAMTYTTVLVAGMDTMRASTLDLLQRFANAGGRVIVAGTPPAYVDAEPSGRAALLAAECISVAFREAELVAALDGHTVARVKIVDAATGQTATDIFCQLRQDEESYYLTVLNSNREKGYELKLSLSGVDASIVEEWDLESGEGGCMGSALNVSCSLAPSGVRCFRLVRDSALQPALKSPAFEESLYALDGAVAYEMGEPNVCVLELAEWSVDGETYAPVEDILQIDQKVRRHFGVTLREHNSVQPWVRAKEPFPILGRVQLKYTFEIGADCFGVLQDMVLVMETPQRYQVRINDADIPTDCDDGFWCDIALRKIKLTPDCLKAGTNTITLETDFREDLNLEAIYLLGHFAVRMKGIVPVLGALPRQVSLTDLVKQGFPYYSGAFRYSFETPPQLIGNECRITLPPFEGACAKISSGDAEKLIPWRPHKAILTLRDTFQIEISITRKNTFGPLHNKNPRPTVTHPGTFMANGVNYSLEPVFLESGLLGSINLQKAASVLSRG